MAGYQGEITSSQLPEVLPEGKEVILVVDDDEQLLELVEDTLETLGYAVFTATNGADAMELLAEHSSISLLFSDVIMPGGMNGVELANQANEQRPDLKVLLTSGDTQKVNIDMAPDVNLLVKPYSLETFAQRIRSILDESKPTST